MSQMLNDNARLVSGGADTAGLDAKNSTAHAGNGWAGQRQVRVSKVLRGDAEEALEVFARGLKAQAERVNNR